MFRHLWVTAMFLGLTACGQSQEPPVTGDLPEQPATLSLSGTVYAPEGGDVAGTVVVSCFVVNDGCDEMKSDVYEVQQAGSSASFAIGGLEAASYLLLAVKDANGNDRYGDEGDYRGVYETDGTVIPPAQGLELRMSVIGQDDPTPGPQPTPAAYSVTGVVLDTQGRPMPNALVQIVPSLTRGLVEVRTDAEGRYTVTGLLDMPYKAYAYTTVSYEGQTYCLRLGHADLRHYDAFTPSQGVVRNFRWQLTGPIADREGHYFGGTLTAFNAGAWAGYGRALEFTFTSTGPKLDGSEGESFTYTFEFGGPQFLEINDIPIAPYILTIALVGFDGSRTPVKMGPETFESHYPDMEIAWRPLECGYLNSVANNYTWLALPGE